MNYGIEFTPKADEALGQLPGMVAHAVLNALDRLAADPIGLGKPSHFPFLPGRQMYQFTQQIDAGRWWVTIFFRYSEDEQRIIILDVAGMDIG